MPDLTEPLSELPPPEEAGDQPTRVPIAMAAGHVVVAAILGIYGAVNLLVLDPYDSGGASIVEIVFDPHLWSNLLVYASSYLALAVAAGLAVGVAAAAGLIVWRRPVVSKARAVMLFGPVAAAALAVALTFAYWSAG